MSKGKNKNSVKIPPLNKSGIVKKQINPVPFLYAIIFIFAFLLYGNTISNKYALDDDFVVLNNKIVHQGLKGIPHIFASRYTDMKGGTFGYRPITKASLAIEYQFFGENPHVSHFINVLLYALTGMFLFYLMRKFLKSFSFHLPFIITLLFMAHPIHTEVVASIKNREEILSFLGGLIFLHFSVKYIENKKIIFLIFSLLGFVFGILSKLSVLPFLIVVPLFIYYFSDLAFLPVVSLKLNIKFLHLSLKKRKVVKEENPVMKNINNLKAEPQKSKKIIITVNGYLSDIGNNVRSGMGSIIKWLRFNYIFIPVIAIQISSLFFQIPKIPVIIFACLMIHYLQKHFHSAFKVIPYRNYIYIILTSFVLLALSFSNELLRFSAHFNLVSHFISILLFIFCSTLLLRNKKYSRIKIFLTEMLSSKKLSAFLFIFLFSFSVLSFLVNSKYTDFSKYVRIFSNPDSNFRGLMVFPVIALIYLVSRHIFRLRAKNVKTNIKAAVLLIVNIIMLLMIDFFYTSYNHILLNNSIINHFISFFFKIFNRPFIITDFIQPAFLLRELVFIASLFLSLVIAPIIKSPAESIRTFISFAFAPFRFLFVLVLKLSIFLINITKRIFPFAYRTIGRKADNIKRIILKSPFRKLIQALSSFLKELTVKPLYLLKQTPPAFKQILFIALAAIVLLLIIQKSTNKYLPKEDARLYQWQNPLFKENVVDAVKTGNPDKTNMLTSVTEKVVVTSQNKSVIERIKLGAISSGFYIKKLIIPSPLLFYYGYNMFPYNDIIDYHIIIPIIVILALLFIAIKGVKRKTIISFSVFYFIISISMFINLVTPITGIVGERLAYIPSLAFSIATGYLLFSLSNLKKLKLSSKNRQYLMYFLLIILLVPYMFISVNRNKDWKDMHTLMSKDILHLHNSAMANVIYASVLQSEFYKTLAQNKPDMTIAEEAVIHYKQALEVYPYFHNSWNNLGTIYSDVYKKFAESIPYFLNAMKYKPDYTEACFNLAYNYERINKTDSAFFYYAKTLTLDSANIKGISYMANLYFTTGDTGKAFYWNRRIMKMDSLSDIPYIDMGNYYFHLNIIPKAIYYWETAFHKNPGNYGLCMNLATYYKQTGNLIKADFYYNKANQAQNR